MNHRQYVPHVGRGFLNPGIVRNATENATVQRPPGMGNMGNQQARPTMNRRRQEARQSQPATTAGRRRQSRRMSICVKDAGRPSITFSENARNAAFIWIGGVARRKMTRTRLSVPCAARFAGMQKMSRRCARIVASRGETMTEEPPFVAYDDCPRCGSNEVTVTEAGRLVCAGCGLPVEEM